MVNPNTDRSGSQLGPHISPSPSVYLEHPAFGPILLPREVRRYSHNGGKTIGFRLSLVRSLCAQSAFSVTVLPPWHRGFNARHTCTKSTTRSQASLVKFNSTFDEVRGTATVPKGGPGPYLADIFAVQNAVLVAREPFAVQCVAVLGICCSLFTTFSVVALLCGPASFFSRGHPRAQSTLFEPTTHLYST